MTLHNLHLSSELAAAFPGAVLDTPATREARTNLARAIADIRRAQADWIEARSDFDANAALDRQCSARLCAGLFFEKLTGLSMDEFERAMR